MSANSMAIASSTKTASAFLPVLTGLFTATLLISNESGWPLDGQAS